MRTPGRCATAVSATCFCCATAVSAVLEGALAAWSHGRHGRGTDPGHGRHGRGTAEARGRSPPKADGASAPTTKPDREVEMPAASKQDRPVTVLLIDDQPIVAET